MALDPKLPTNLPNEDWIIRRMGSEDPVKNAQVLSTYATLTPIVLAEMAAATELMFPAADFVSERIVYDGKGDFLLPAHWPVTKITKVLMGGQAATLRIAGANGANQIDISRGLADVAIGEDGEVIQLSPWLSRGGLQGIPFFADYRAGYDVLPLDLLEVFTELAWLMAIEYQRRGKASERVDMLQMNFTRELPLWAKRTLQSYKRIQVYV